MSAETPSTVKLHWYISVALALFVFVVVGMYSMNMARNTTGYDEEQARERLEKLTKMRDQDAKTLFNADWVDKDKGIVRIPIDEAMTQEVSLLKNDQPRAGTQIPGATPAAALPVPNAQPANATAPPPASGRASDNGGSTPKPTK